MIINWHIFVTSFSILLFSRNLNFANNIIKFKYMRNLINMCYLSIVFFYASGSIKIYLRSLNSIFVANIIIFIYLYLSKCNGFTIHKLNVSYMDVIYSRKIAFDIKIRHLCLRSW